MELAEIREVVHAGKVLIFPTDTIYGLGCDAFQEKALQRIYRIKGRAPERPLSVHVSSVEAIEHLATLTERQRFVIKKLLPGPYTVVLKASPHAPPLCISSEGKIGLRIPKSRSFRLISEAADRPLVGTSVNRSGELPLVDIAQLSQQFCHEVDLIIATDEPMTQESSTVIDITFDPPRVLRGSLPEGLLELEDC
jgi:L-threonylcarbamoyladenylate synthase